jgi:hypothetical protein
MFLSLETATTTRYAFSHFVWILISITRSDTINSSSYTSAS